MSNLVWTWWLLNWKWSLKWIFILGIFGPRSQQKELSYTASFTSVWQNCIKSHVTRVWQDCITSHVTRLHYKSRDKSALLVTLAGCCDVLCVYFAWHIDRPGWCDVTSDTNHTPEHSQSEASIQVTWSLPTNQRPVSVTLITPPDHSRQLFGSKGPHLPSPVSRQCPHQSLRGWCPSDDHSCNLSRLRVRFNQIAAEDAT